MSANPSTDLLVITAASGKQVGALLPLITNWSHLRLVVNSSSSEQKLKSSHPNAEIVIVDLAQPSECAKILKDATALYHIGPSFHPHETEIGYNMIDAAVAESKNGKLKHFVYSSVLNSQLRKLMNHDCKRFVEEYVMESGLNYTVLQPTHFMDLFPVTKFIEEDGNDVVYPANWNPDTPFSFVALKDLGEAAKVILEERERHFLATYPIVGTTPTTYRRVCEVVGEVIGKKVVAKQRAFEEAVELFSKVLFGEGTKEGDGKRRDGLERLLLYYNQHGLVGNPNVLGWLIGRKPTSYREWAEGKKDAAKRL
jgi:uncharacterized protein YbjT (DUF2867 family)